MAATEFISSSFYATSNLKAYLRFEGNSNDTTVGAHNGTDTAITYGTDYGKFTQGALFNGSTSKILFTDHADFKPTGAFTIAAWVKSTTTGAYMHIFNSYSVSLGPTVAKGIYLRKSATNKLNFGVSSGTQVEMFGTTSLPTTGFNLVVATFDGVNTGKVYLNGALDGTKTDFSAPSYAATNYVAVGVDREDATTYAFYWNGSIDDVAICNGTALSLTQIEELYNKTLGGAFLNNFV